MGEYIKKNPLIAILIFVIAISLAAFSLIRSFNLTGNKVLNDLERLQVEQDTHAKIQQELQQKYGVKPTQYGLPSDSAAVGGGGGKAPKSDAPRPNASGN